MKLETYIPTHLEIDPDSVVVTDYQLTVALRARQVRPFTEYVDIYCKKKIAQDSEIDIRELVDKEEYFKIPIEIAMGIIRDICADNGTTWHRWTRAYEKGELHSDDPVKKICPVGFLKALFS